MAQIKSLCSSQVKKGFLDYEVVYAERTLNPNCSKPVIFLGETHIKSNSLARKGEAVLDLFKVRGYEGVSSKDLDRLQNSDGFKSLLSAYSIAQRFEKWGLIGFSTIRKAQVKGLDVSYYPRLNGETLNLGKTREKSPWNELLQIIGNNQDTTDISTTISPGLLSKFSKQSPEELSNNILKDPVMFIKVFGNFINKDGGIYTNLWLEYGDLDSYNINCKEMNKNCDEFTVKERNRRFARNIRDLTKVLPCNVPMLVILGKRHLSGVAWHLKNIGFNIENMLGKSEIISDGHVDFDFKGIADESDRKRIGGRMLRIQLDESNSSNSQ
jgi:hypothetical protein